MKVMRSLVGWSVMMSSGLAEQGSDGHVVIHNVVSVDGYIADEADAQTRANHP